MSRLRFIVALFLFVPLLPSKKYLVVYFLYVGQADSSYIITPNGRTILIDGGDRIDNFDAGEEIVVPFIKSTTDTISLVIASHPHRDHIGGLISVISKLKVDLLLEPGIPYPSSTYAEFLNEISSRKVRYKVLRGKSRLYVDPELDIVVFHPEKELKFDDVNNNSIVLRINYGKISVLFTGDIEFEAEKHLVKKYGYGLKSTVLKSPHHGSYTSSTALFLDYVSPEVVVISCGRDNPFGHPHDVVLNRYYSRGIKVYRTDEDGTICFKTDGVRYKIRTNVKSPRFGG